MEASTGRVLETFEDIAQCVINEAGNKVITCHKNYTCKVGGASYKYLPFLLYVGHLSSFPLQVWELPKKLLFTFEDHLFDIKSCDLSPDSQLVVSADSSSAVKVSLVHVAYHINLYIM